MQSVVSELQKERTRLEDELHRITNVWYTAKFAL
jgi:hypothetical protein